MAEAEMCNMKANESDLWLMDGGIPYDPSLLDGFVPPQEVEDAIEAYFAEMFNEDRPVPSAA